MRASGPAYLTAAAVHALVVVAAEGLAVDEGERGDDEDDAGRCRSDARAQPSTAFVAAESGGGTVARAGVDITREREKNFRELRFCQYPKWKAPTLTSVQTRSRTCTECV